MGSSIPPSRRAHKASPRKASPKPRTSRLPNLPPPRKGKKYLANPKLLITPEALSVTGRCAYLRGFLGKDFKLTEPDWMGDIDGPFGVGICRPIGVFDAKSLLDRPEKYEQVRQHKMYSRSRKVAEYEASVYNLRAARSDWATWAIVIENRNLSTAITEVNGTNAWLKEHGINFHVHAIPWIDGMVQLSTGDTINVTRPEGEVRAPGQVAMLMMEVFYQEICKQRTAIEAAVCNAAGPVAMPQGRFFRIETVLGSKRRIIRPCAPESEAVAFVESYNKIGPKSGHVAVMTEIDVGSIRNAEAAG